MSVPRPVRRTGPATRLGLVTVLLGALVVPLAAQTDSALEALPGYLDPDRLELYSDPDGLKVEVNLQGPMIRFVAEALRGAEEEGELADALAKIASIRFQLFELDAAGSAPVLDRTRKSAEWLEGERLAAGGFRSATKRPTATST